MAKSIGPSFPYELQAASVPTDGWSWGSDGTFSYSPGLSQSTKDAIATVYAAHDPAAAVPDTAQTNIAGQVFDSNKLLLAVTTYMIQRLNELRTQPAQSFPALTANQVRTAVIAIYKALP